jgi:hypothetical protein
VWLNGLAVIALLIGLVRASLPADQVKRFADAMLVFGAASVCGLASAFFAYIGRTFRLERPHLIGWRRPIRWLAILAAIAGAVCFIGTLNMARVAVLPRKPLPLRVRPPLNPSPQHQVRQSPDDPQPLPC